MKKKFSWRSFISFGLLFAFFILLLSGIILYIAPAGRIANWTYWKLMGLSKSGWQALHTVFALTFVILSVFHLFTVNWKTFWSYLKSKAKRGINKQKELLTATGMTLVIFFGVMFGIPPFQTIMTWGEQFTEGWEKEETEPPIPHAESYTLEDFAVKILKIAPDTAMKQLKDNHIVVTGLQQTIAEIAEENQLAPQVLYQVFETSENIDTPFPTRQIIQSGNGIGRKTLAEIAEMYDIPVQSFIEALHSAGISEATGESVIKTLADKHKMLPSEILDILNQHHE